MGLALNLLCSVTVQTRGADDVHHHEREGQRWLRSESDLRSPEEGEKCSVTRKRILSRGVELMKVLSWG